MSDSEQNRQDIFQWINNRAVWTIGAAIASVVLLCLLMWVQYQLWTPLQRYWLPQYFWCETTSSKSTNVRLLAIEDANGAINWLEDEDVQSGRTRLENGRTIPLMLSDAAANAGKQFVLLESKKRPTADVKQYLEGQVYANQTLADLLRDLTYRPLAVALVFLIFGLFYGVPKDRERLRERREGRRTKGTELVTVKGFVARVGGDGVGFLALLPRNLLDFLKRRSRQLLLRIPRAMESYHIALCGDPGGGKTSLSIGILMQVRQREEIAIVHDPAMEFVPRFYDPSRGDIIFNPVDERMFYWPLAEEIEDEAEAQTIAAALFPDTDRREPPFFVSTPRRIFAHLLSYTPKPTVAELIRWLCDEGVLQKALFDTELSSTLYDQAGPQRGAVLASIAKAVDSLKLLPGSDEGMPKWTVRQWAQRPRGWIFITSPAMYRERLKPLISMFLDILILRLLNSGQPAPVPVWFLLDELASLEVLPQLPTALTQQRKSLNPIVYAFQGPDQIKHLYGAQAPVMLSAGTRLFMHTKEESAAEWVSRCIGDHEATRMSETRTENQDENSRSEHLVREKLRTVMAAEIMGMKSREAYLKFENLVVWFRFPYIELPELCAQFVPRKLRRELARPAILSGNASPSPTRRPPALPPKKDKPDDLVF